MKKNTSYEVQKNVHLGRTPLMKEFMLLFGMISENEACQVTMGCGWEACFQRTHHISGPSTLCCGHGGGGCHCIKYADVGSNTSICIDLIGIIRMIDHPIKEMASWHGFSFLLPTFQKTTSGS